MQPTPVFTFGGYATFDGDSRRVEIVFSVFLSLERPPLVGFLRRRKPAPFIHEGYEEELVPNVYPPKECWIYWSAFVSFVVILYFSPDWPGYPQYPT